MQSQAFAPLHPAIFDLSGDRFPGLNECNYLLSAHQPTITVHSGQVLRFVEQEYGKLPFEAQYEPRCYLKGEVPTREHNWHDLLNALVWLTFPKAKAAINARHFQAFNEVQTDDPHTHSQRGSVRDAITLLDESGVIVPYADKELAELLQNFQWKELFWQYREQVRSGMGFYLFGHGLYEKAIKPYIGMTGQGLLLPVQKEFFAWPPEKRLAHLDELLADYLSAAQHCRSTRELSPVPLLGVPGWAAENECAEFYDNTAYFRSGRQSRAQRDPLSTAPSSVAG
ncbi:MAG: DUF3025 domain-containing protein [Gallionella sp.]|nr:DUF3025 domain-containing protein [Gallionella sp.]